MKVFLLHPDHDPEPALPASTTREALVDDLELDTLLDAMAGKDQFLRDTAQRVVLRSETDLDVIRYRQSVLADVLDHRATVQDLYDNAVDAIHSERKVPFGLFRDAPESLLRRSVQVMQILMDNLKRLREITDEHGDRFRSCGFARLFRSVGGELDDDYLALIAGHLDQLRLRGGVLMSADLGKGNTGTHYALHRPPERGLLQRLTGLGRDGYGFQIAERDEQRARDLRELAGRGLESAAQALAQSVEHVIEFFRALRTELGFYLACANLQHALDEHGLPTCYPDPIVDRPSLHTRGLRDPCLALERDQPVVGNDVDGDDKTLVVITGANEGGKSTFLRSVGIAQLMMQCGMFVVAAAYRADVRTGIYTHFTREEDSTMTRGKLDDELARMRDVSDAVRAGGLVLCNESFSSTNEIEGSEIAHQVVQALTESGIKVVYVTHLFGLARRLHRSGLTTSIFLRAERGPGGQRTFRLIEAPPEPTSHGKDSYYRIFK